MSLFCTSSSLSLSLSLSLSATRASVFVCVCASVAVPACLRISVGGDLCDAYSWPQVLESHKDLIDSLYDRGFLRTSAPEGSVAPELEPDGKRPGSEGEEGEASAEAGQESDMTEDGVFTDEETERQVMQQGGQDQLDGRLQGEGGSVLEEASEDSFFRGRVERGNVNAW